MVQSSFISGVTDSVLPPAFGQECLDSERVLERDQVIGKRQEWRVKP